MEDAKRVPESQEYNCYEHRKIKKANSDIRSLANLIKASLGTGILAVPLAFANSGWGAGIIGTIVVAFICGHCIHIFVKSSKECCEKARIPSLTYAETCRVAFAVGPESLRRYSNSAGLFADFTMTFTYIGACCILTVLVADSSKQLFDQYVPGFHLRIEYWCVIAMMPLLLMVQIRYLKTLSIFSFMANVLLVFIFGICAYYVFKDEIILSDKKVVGLPARFPMFLSTIIFAMEGIGIVMPVENNMKHPQHFLGCPSILVVAMTFIATIYTIMGVFGYLRYGDELRGSITLNLPIEEWPAICAKVFIVLSVLLTYPLNFFVAFEAYIKYIEPRVKKENRNVIQILARVALVLFCGSIGIALPALEQIINISGAVSFSLLGLIIPGIVEIVVRWQNFGKFKWILWKNILIVLFGFTCLFSGLIVAILDVIEKFSKKVD